jgi:hypothetical protein
VFRESIEMPFSLPHLPDSSCAGTTGSVPVYNCVVILRVNPESQRLTASVANLPGLTAEGTSERDLLILLTKRFKAVIQDCLRRNDAIPWIDPAVEPVDGEQQRFIPVHL